MILCGRFGWLFNPLAESVPTPVICSEMFIVVCCLPDSSRRGVGELVEVTEGVGLLEGSLVGVGVLVGLGVFVGPFPKDSVGVAGTSVGSGVGVDVGGGQLRASSSLILFRLGRFFSWNLGRRLLPTRLGVRQASLESLYATGRIHDFIRSGIKRVALTAYFHIEFFNG